MGVEVAKRFADTRLSREKWYRILSPAMKCAVRFLFDECDEAGAWAIDEEQMEFSIGERVLLNDLLSATSRDGKIRIKRLGTDKLFLPGFIAFQYGELSPDCKPHLKIIRRLKELTIWIEYLKGFETLEEEDKEKEEDKERKKGGLGENKKPALARKFPVTGGELAACLDEWRTTLLHFQISRPLNERDEVGVARAIQDFSASWVKLALLGARKQKPGKNFDPKNFVSLSIYFHKDRVERLVNIGAGTESADGIDWSAVFGKASA